MSLACDNGIVGISCCECGGAEIRFIERLISEMKKVSGKTDIYRY